GASSLFAGNTQGANAAFGTLGSNAANLRKLSDNLKGKVDDELKKKKAKYNMADIEKKAQDKLENDLPKIFSNLPADQRKALGDFSSFGLGGGVVPAPVLADDKNADKKEVLASVQAALAKQKSGGGGDAFKFDFGDDAATPDNAAGTALNQGD